MLPTRANGVVGVEYGETGLVDVEESPEGVTEPGSELPLLEIPCAISTGLKGEGEPATAPPPPPVSEFPRGEESDPELEVPELELFLTTIYPTIRPRAIPIIQPHIGMPKGEPFLVVGFPPALGFPTFASGIIYAPQMEFYRGPVR